MRNRMEYEFDNEVYVATIRFTYNYKKGVPATFDDPGHGPEIELWNTQIISVEDEDGEVNVTGPLEREIKEEFLEWYDSDGRDTINEMIEEHENSGDDCDAEYDYRKDEGLL